MRATAVLSVGDIGGLVGHCEAMDGLVAMLHSFCSTFPFFASHTKGCPRDLVGSSSGWLQTRQMMVTPLSTYILSTPGFALGLEETGPHVYVS